jgi:hypothetical protein
MFYSLPVGRLEFVEYLIHIDTLRWVELTAVVVGVPESICHATCCTWERSTTERLLRKACLKLVEMRSDMKVRERLLAQGHTAIATLSLQNID